jgi:hypothetical protein
VISYLGMTVRDSDLRLVEEPVAGSSSSARCRCYEPSQGGGRGVPVVRWCGWHDVSLPSGRWCEGGGPEGLDQAGCRLPSRNQLWNVQRGEVRGWRQVARL